MKQKLPHTTLLFFVVFMHNWPFIYFSVIFLLILSDISYSNACPTIIMLFNLLQYVSSTCAITKIPISDIFRMLLMVTRKLVLISMRSAMTVGRKGKTGFAYLVALYSAADM